MLRLCAFADEISADLDEQIRVCRRCGIRRIELRSAGGVNVLDLTARQRESIRSRLAESGMSVACIGSPIGKARITEPWERQFDRFKVAVELADLFGAPMVRLFSYYPPEGAGGDWRAAYRDEVMRRMRLKAEHVAQTDITLVHENEAEIFGERLADCVELMREIDSPKLRFAFDFANFILVGERPAENWRALKPYVTHFHIKDARLSDRRIVPAGQGDGQMAATLSDAYRSGYRGLLSLEPHLAQAGKFSGFSGADLFGVAVDALREVCGSAGVPLEENPADAG
jgi:sugar phosphate isomerase/epimerase